MFSVFRNWFSKSNCYLELKVWGGGWNEKKVPSTGPLYERWLQNAFTKWTSGSRGSDIVWYCHWIWVEAKWTMWFHDFCLTPAFSCSKSFLLQFIWGNYKKNAALPRITWLHFHLINYCFCWFIIQRSAVTPKHFFLLLKCLCAPKRSTPLIILIISKCSYLDFDFFFPIL